MVNLKSRIEDLKKSTGSLSAKELCENAQTKLSEINEMRITREASNEITNSVLESLLNDLKKIEEKDSAVNTFVQREEKTFKIHNLGVKEAFEKIAESDLKSHPALSYLLEAFKASLSKPEYMTAPEFCARLNSFDWHPVIKESVNSVRENIESNKDEIAIYRAIHELKNSKSSYILSGINEALENFLLNRNKASKATLVEKLNKFTFDPLVRNLSNTIREAKEGEFFVDPRKGSALVEKVYSPVMVNEDSAIFGIGNNFYERIGDKIGKLTNEEVSQLDPDFVYISRLVADSSVKVNEDNITVYARNKKVIIKENEISVNDKTVSPEDFQKIYMNEAVFRRDEIETMRGISKLTENFDNIVEIEFAKSFVAPMIGNRRIDVLKINEGIYLTKEDPAMGTLDFFKNLNATQTRKIVLEFLNHDISESFADMLSEEEREIKAIEETKQTYIETISQLEEKHKELTSIVDEDVTNTPEFKEIIETLESEITGLKEEYNEFVADAHKIVNEPKANEESVAPELTNDSVIDFEVDEKVFCKKIDAEAVITGIDSTSGYINLLTDGGESITCTVDEIEKIMPDVDESKVTVKVDGKEVEIEGEDDEDSEDEDDEDSDEEDEDNIKKIDEPMGESKVSESHITVGSEVELKDGRRGMVQGENESQDEYNVLTDDGESHTLKGDDLKVITSPKDGGHAPEIEGQQNDGNSVQVDENLNESKQKEADKLVQNWINANSDNITDKELDIEEFVNNDKDEELIWDSLKKLTKNMNKKQRDEYYFNMEILIANSK